MSNISKAQFARTICRMVNSTCVMQVFDIFNGQYFILKFKMAATEPQMGPGVHGTQNPLFTSSWTHPVILDIF